MLQLSKLEKIYNFLINYNYKRRLLIMGFTFDIIKIFMAYI